MTHGERTPVDADRAGSKDTNGHEPAFNAFDTPAANEKHRLRHEAEAITEKRHQKWGRHRYAVDILDGSREPWALKLQADIARRNACAIQ